MQIDDPYERPALEAVLAASSDPDNPGPDELHDWVRETYRIAVVGLSRDPAKAARGRVCSFPISQKKRQHLTKCLWSNGTRNIPT